MNQLLAYTDSICTNGTGACGQVEVDRGAVAAMVAFFGAFFAVLVLIGTLLFAFWVWMLVDAFKKQEADYQQIGSGDKNLWVILLLVSLPLGFWPIVAIVYFFVVYQKAKSLNKATKTKK